jgi:hypothetical protein
MPVLPGSTPALLAVCRFHLRVGARLALAVLVTAFATAAGALMFVRPELVRDLAQALFGSRAGLPEALLVLGAAALTAAVAAPRVCAGLGGWVRHLPVAGSTHRRAATAAIALAEAPLLAILALLVAVAWARQGAAAPHLVGLPVAAVAAAQLVLPSRRRAVVRPLALASGILAGLGNWPALAAALPLAAAADLAAGQLRPRQPRWAWRPLGALGRRPAPPLRIAGLLPALIGWRALGWRLARCCGVALTPWLATLLFLRNNQLSPLHAARAALLGGGAACALLLATLAQSLAMRRPAWPWARSLPWRASRRVLLDAVLLGLPCLPFLGLAALLAPAAGAPLAASLPLLAVRAAGAMRRPAESRQGPAGEVLIEGLLAAGLVALLPWAAAALLAAAPWAVAAAAARERRQKVGLWMERQHLAAGDPNSWSGW